MVIKYLQIMTEKPAHLQAIYNRFEDLGENQPEKLDPFNWGSHLDRYYLWIVQGLLTLPEGSEYKYIFGISMSGIRKLFRLLDTNNEDDEKTFIEQLKLRYGIEVKQPLPPRKPTSK